MFRILFLILAILPRFVAADLAYATGSAGVTVINTDTQTVVAGPFASPSGSLFQAAITPNGRFVYSTTSTNRVVVFDTETNTFVGSPIVVGTAPRGLIVTPNGAFVYVANSGNGTVSVISTATNTVVAIIGGFSTPTAVAVSPSGSFVYVAGGGGLFVVSTATNTVTAAIGGFGLFSDLEGVTITPNGAFAYVSNTGLKRVAVVNLATSTVITNIDMSPSVAPRGIATNASGSLVYAGLNFSGNAAAIISTATNTLLANVPVPSGATSIVDVVALTSSGAFAYVTDRDNSRIIVINTATNTTTEIALTGSVLGLVMRASGAPRGLSGQQKKNDFGLEFERVNIISWGAPASAVAGYFVYRDGVLIATLGSPTLEFQDHNRPKGVTTVYTVTSFINTSLGAISSAPQSVVVSSR